MRVFLSYCGEDQQLADLLFDLLEAVFGAGAVFKADKARQGIPAATDWRDTIRREIRGADRLVTLVTEKSKDTRWTWIESGGQWVRDPESLLLIATPDLISTDLYPFDHLEAIFLQQGKEDHFKRWAEEVWQALGITRSWSGAMEDKLQAVFDGVDNLYRKPNLSVNIYGEGMRLMPLKDGSSILCIVHGFVENESRSKIVIRKFECDVTAGGMKSSGSEMIAGRSGNVETLGGTFTNGWEKWLEGVHAPTSPLVVQGGDSAKVKLGFVVAFPREIDRQAIWGTKGSVVVRPVDQAGVTVATSNPLTKEFRRDAT